MPLNSKYEPIVTAYAQYLQTLGYAESTVYAYPRFVARFLSWAQQRGIQRADGLTSQLVHHYFEYLQQQTIPKTYQTYSTAYLNRNFGAIDNFLTFLHHTGLHQAPSPTGYMLTRIRKKPL